MDVREMLKTLLENGYTEEAIAKGVSVNQSTISRILRGVIRDPKASIAIKISSLLEDESQKCRGLYV